MAGDFTAEVGSYTREKDRPDFKEPDLKFPLVCTTSIGRARDYSEQEICGYKHMEGSNISFFTERPNLNGPRIVIPDNVYRNISRDHGKLRMNAPSRNDVNFDYMHTSLSDLYTYLWIPSEGIVKAVRDHGEIMDLLFPKENKPMTDRYLLIGGSDEKNIPLISYYVRVIRNDR